MGLKGSMASMGTKGPRASGSQGIAGFPMLSGASKGVGIFRIHKFQGSRDGGFKGFKARGLEGERAPRFS